MTETKILDIAIDLDGRLFAGAHDGGVFLSRDNGNNWAEINNGVTHARVPCLTIDGDGRVFAGMQDGQVFSLQDDDESRREIIKGLG